MDYKEEYLNALERAKKGLPIDEVFPELKESEDERIRKFLVELVSNDKANNYNGLYNDRGVRFDDVLAYLEKLKDIDCLACDQHLKGYIAGRKVTEEEKQKEQKSVEWGEEDERNINTLISVIKAHYNEYDLVRDDYPINARELGDWLKSLHPQPHWKPSEEQIDALEWMLTTVSMKDGGRGVVLKNLINDLKKKM